MKFAGTILLALVACVATSAGLADETFNVRLSPTPRDAAMKTQIAGHGSARVALRGDRLSIAGNFAAFPSPATRAALHRGRAIALRGPVVHPLTVSSGTSGALSAEVTLSAEELTALAAGQLYIQIDTELAPEGNVWGWLLPAAVPMIRDQ